MASWTRQEPRTNKKTNSAQTAGDVTKTNTTSVDTSRSPDFGCLGYILDGRPSFYRITTKRHTRSSELDAGRLKELPGVDIIIYGHGNGSRDLVDSSIRAGARGIVIAGVGNGDIFPSEKETLVDGTKKGVIVVRASRTGSGIATHAEEYDRYGFVGSNDLNPQKARILPMLALAKTAKPAEIQRMFDEY